MKVVLLNNDFRVFWKGRLIYLKKFLAERNIELEVVELFGKGSPYSFDSYNNQERWWTCLFPNNSANELSKQEIERALFDILSQIEPDVVIASSIVFFAGALGIRWSKKNKKKFIMFDDAKPSQFKRNFLVQKIKDLITDQIDGFWLPSDEYYKEFPGLYNKNVHFFYGYNCIDNSLFNLGKKKELNHNTIICVARLVPIKNIDSLLHAWQILEKTNLNYKLIIIGNGPEYANLNKLKVYLKLENVEFLDTIANNDLPEYFYNSDGFILPSLSETWGLVVNEAMAAGLPVLLSTKINAAHSLLKEGVTGFSFDPLNIHAMAEAINKFSSLDVSSKTSMSAAALAAIDVLNYENMGLKLTDALNKITAGKFKKPGLIAASLINLWYGKYDTSSWYKLERNYF